MERSCSKCLHNRLIDHSGHGPLQLFKFLSTVFVERNWLNMSGDDRFAHRKLVMACRSRNLHGHSGNRIGPSTTVSNGTRGSYVGDVM